MPRHLSWILGLALAILGCEDNGIESSGGSSRVYYTFGGTVYFIREDAPGRAESIGIRTGDSVYYVFAVDTLRLGFEQYPDTVYLKDDSLDRPGQRPRWFFDSLMSVPLQGRPPLTMSGTETHVGYRTEQENGYAGTFLTSRYSTMDSSLLVAICFNDFVGGPTLPNLGDVVSGTEQFAYNVANSSTFISSELKVLAIGRTPWFPK